jgi:thiol:disulfide interchange protein DsbA
LFDAIVKQGKEFRNIGDIADFLASEGLKKDDFLKAANSFSVKMKTDRAARTWKAYGIDGTPANAVNGKYITAPHMAGTREGALEVIEKLIDQERKALAAK